MCLVVSRPTEEISPPLFLENSCTALCHSNCRRYLSTILPLSLSLLSPLPSSMLLEPQAELPAEWLAAGPTVVACVGNTIGIMPQDIKEQVVLGTVGT